MIDEVERENSYEKNIKTQAQNKCKDFYKRAVRFYPPFADHDVGDASFTAFTKNGEIAVLTIVSDDRVTIKDCRLNDHISPVISRSGSELYEKGYCGPIERKRFRAYQHKEVDGRLSIYDKQLQEPLCITYGRPSLWSTVDQITKKSNPDAYQLTILR